MTEAAKRAKDAVEHALKTSPGDHAGEEIVVVIFVPNGIEVMAHEMAGIGLTDIRVEKSTCNIPGIPADLLPVGATPYRITGIVP